MSAGERVRLGLARAYWRISRWRLVQEEPPVHGARVVIGAPHTSNWDFVLMLAVAWREGLESHWLGKHQLFAAPFGGIMRALGGIPVDRRDPAKVVEEVVAVMHDRGDVVLVVTPEGTRGRSSGWRSGFYRIAIATGVPVTLGYVDGTTMTCGLGPTIDLTGDVGADMDRIRAFYADKSGVRQEHRTEPRLRDESGEASTN